MKIFNDLICRGLKRVLVIVSDDFPGLSEVIKHFSQIQIESWLATFYKEYKETYGKK